MNSKRRVDTLTHGTDEIISIRYAHSCLRFSFSSTALTLSYIKQFVN